MEMKIICQRCKKSFILTRKQHQFLSEMAKKKKTELILPKFCSECRILRMEIKSIPKKIQQLCNILLGKDYIKDEDKKMIRVIYGLTRKEVKYHLLSYGFMNDKKNDKKEDKK